MLRIEENTLKLEQYLGLREAVGWKRLSTQQAQQALANSLYTVSAYDGDKLVGMGRIVGDGAVICYIQDLVVDPEAQGLGVGSVMIKKLTEYVNSLRKENTEIMLCLMCAKGRENFYEQHGFMSRPTDSLGPGMIMYINDKTRGQ